MACVVYQFVSLDIEIFFKRRNVSPKSISFKSNISSNFVELNSYLFTVGFCNLEHFEVTDKLNIAGNFSTLQYIHSILNYFFSEIFYIYTKSKLSFFKLSLRMSWRCTEDVLNENQCVLQKNQWENKKVIIIWQKYD